MGDAYWSIVDVDATEDEAPELAAEVLVWLVEQGIVLADEDDCVIGAASGYPPGPKQARALKGTYEVLPNMPPNGLRIVTGRTVFYSGWSEEIACPHCSEIASDGTGPGWDALAERIRAWWEGTSTGDAACGACGQRVGLNEWLWTPPWAFANLGFEFWNWGELDRAFLAEVGRLLGRHRVVQPRGEV